jgi:hypothetical protein
VPPNEEYDRAKSDIYGLGSIVASLLLLRPHNGNLNLIDRQMLDEI